MSRTPQVVMETICQPRWQLNTPDELTVNRPVPTRRDGGPPGVVPLGKELLQEE